MNIKLDIPTEFFEGEERCGYYVSPEMKKVWAVELDLIAEFARVCDKHNIRWFADGGTLLGAARHKGFIPWDDDVDVIMLREDYERFCKVAQEEFAYPYFFDEIYKEAKRFVAHSKLYNESTTMIDIWTKDDMKRESIEDFDYRQGIHIDIFIADNVPDDEREFLRMKRKASWFRLVANKLFHTYEHYRPAYTALKIPFKATVHYVLKILHALGVKIPTSRDLFHKYMETITSYRGKDTKRVANLAFIGDKILGGSRNVWDRSDFSGTVCLPFEMLTLPVASGYENRLTKLYGNWHEYVIRYKHGAFYDTEHSYTYYYDKLKAGEDIWRT